MGLLKQKECMLLYWMCVLPEVLSSCKQARRKKLLRRAPRRANLFEPSSGLSSLTDFLQHHNLRIIEADENEDDNMYENEDGDVDQSQNETVGSW